MARPKYAPASGTDAPQLLAQIAHHRRSRDSRAKKLVLAIQRAELQRAAATMEIGRALRALLDQRLYANLGHASHRSLLAAMGVGRSQAFKLMALAELSSAPRIAELGVEAAYAEAIGHRVAVTTRKPS